ncbi:hypothetical protein D3C87_517740 [compost metagenome]
MELYLIHLSGQGDTDIRLVRKDGWDALDNGVFSDQMKADYEATFGDAWGEEQDEMVAELMKMGGGSAENDVALSIPAVVIDGKSASFADLSDYTKFIRNHPEITIVEEYEGYIY